MEIFLIVILCGFFYALGEDNGNKNMLKKIKHNWKTSVNIDDFWYKFTDLWRIYVGKDK